MNLPISRTGWKAAAIAAGLLGVLAAAGASAGDKKDEISFDLVPNPQFVNCLRANYEEEPRDPAFTGSFGLAWYQSDIEVGKHRDEGRVRIKTILLDQIFGFDADVALPPTNTFHVGFWFNNPADAQGCSSTPIKPTPFNGEHTAGPLAMISTSDVTTRLGPLCSDPNTSTKPASCDP